MEIEYACSVKNRFSGIKDAGDPLDTQQPGKARPKAVKKEKPPKPSKVEVPEPPIVSEPVQVPLPMPTVSKPVPEIDVADVEVAEPHQRTTFRRGAEKQRVRGERKEFDRHSGSVKTSVKSEEKRHGAGAFNWGRPEEIVKQEVEEEEVREVEDEPVIAPVSEEPVVEEYSEAQQVETAQVREPSPVQMTMQEYAEILEKQKKRVMERGPTRKPGEGESPNKWAKPVVVYQKKKREGGAVNANVEESDEKADDSSGAEVEEEAVNVRDGDAEIQSVVRNMFAMKPFESAKNSNTSRGPGRPSRPRAPRAPYERGDDRNEGRFGGRASGGQVFHRGGGGGGQMGGGYRQPYRRNFNQHYNQSYNQPHNQPYNQQHQQEQETVYNLTDDSEFPKLS